MWNSADGAQQPQVRPRGSRATTMVGVAVWRHRVLVLVLTLVCAAVAGWLTSVKDASYRAEATVFLSSAAPFDGVGGTGFINDPDRYVGNQASLAASEPVLSRAARQSGVNADVSELQKVVQVIPSRGSDILTVQADGATPALAAQRANAVASAYRSLSGERVKTEAAQLAALAASPTDRASVLQRAAAFGDGVAVLEEGKPPTAPASPSLVVDVSLGVLVGLGLGVAVAIALELRRGRSRRPAPAGSAGSARAAAHGEPPNDAHHGQTVDPDIIRKEAQDDASVGV